MKCSICLWTKLTVELMEDAITIIGGFALCENHTSFIQPVEFRQMCELARREDKGLE